MATYHVIHKETSETQVIECSVHDIMDWYASNPEWERNWSYGCATTASEVGEWREKLVARNPGWNDVLDQASRAPGSRVKKI
jgi:hypothetical protein